MNIEDINRTYSGTYLGLRREGGIAPLYVEEGVHIGSDDAPGVRGSIVIDDETVSKRVKLTSPNLVLDYPNLGMIQHNKTAVWCVRKARRQWHRGLKNETLTRKHIDRRYKSHYGSETPPLQHTMVHSIYNPEFYAYDEALRMLGDERTSVAIDRDFALTNLNGYVNPVLIYRGTDIADIDEGVIKLNTPYLENHIRRTFNASIELV